MNAPRFKCIAEGCNYEGTRRAPPIGCLDSNRCEIVLITAEATHAAAEPEAPEASTPTANRACPDLELTIGGSSWQLQKTTVLGRNGDIATELFRLDVGVSRVHCHLERTPAGWEVLAASAANQTSLNGRTLALGTRERLPVGASVLVLGPRCVINLQLKAAQSTPSFVGELEAFLNQAGAATGHKS